MRKDGVLPRGDWWHVVEAKKASDPTKVYIYDEIGFWGTSAKDFVKELDSLDVNDFELHINSPGGEIFDGFTIYNAIKSHKAYVTAYVDGLAASAASFIAQAADKIVMAKASEMMIHDGIGFAYGNEADMLETARILGNLSNEIADIYAARAGKGTTYWRNLMKETLWMNGSEAVEFGLADEVMSSDNGDTEEAAKEKKQWDMSLVTNVISRDQAEDPSRVAARVVMLSNQKEKNMGDEPSKTDQPETPDTGGTPTGDPQVPGTEVQPDQPSPATADPEPVTADQPETPAPQPTASAAQAGVIINGKLETDWKVIQAHLDVVNQAQKDATEVTRKNFVTKLSDDRKIPATMVDSLTAHALSLNDEQWASFRASYESLPASALFEDHATTQDGRNNSSAGERGQMTPEAKQDRIKILRGVVDQLERSMSPEDVQKSKSYIELQQLESETKE
jgi:ATP-dependent Clp endopeptidase proteolytic subunit ClpP